MMQMKIAVSTMTNCESFLQEGVFPAMQKLHDRGVEAIEISQHIQFDSPAVQEFLSAKEAYNIKICAISVGFAGTQPSPMPPLTYRGRPLKAYSAEQDFEELVWLCRLFDCRYLRFAGFSGAGLRTLEQVRAYMAALERTARRFADEGIGLCVHNHADEFMRAEGKWLLQWALELAPHLSVELDTLNAQKCGLAPTDVLALCAGRVPLLHLQDCAVCPADGGDWLHPEYRGVAVGAGNMNFSAICTAAGAAQAKYLIAEQQNFYGRDPYDCIEDSVKALHALTDQKGGT